jgi:hypothetical protein
MNGRLIHPPSTLIVGLVCLALFAGLAIVSNAVPNPTTTWWTTAVFLAFAAMAAYLLVDYARADHAVSPEGLAYRTLLGRGRFLRWSELRSVRYAPAMKWFRLEAQDGAVVRLSVMLMGLPELAREVLAQAPPSAVDANTRPILETTAQGHPPSVWA